MTAAPDGALPTTDRPPAPTPAGHHPLDDDRTLTFELLRATEAAALATARLFGRGNDDEVDAAAVDAMRPVLGTIAMRAVVVVGEGENDDSPMLYPGEHVGSGPGPLVDLAVDPIDGAGLTARSLPNAMSVIAVADRGAMFDAGPVLYMDKLVVGPDLVDTVEFAAPIEHNLAAVARARGVGLGDVTVALLDRPRHTELIARIRAAGARIKILLDGDLVGALMAVQPQSQVDLLVGTGGTPEGIIAACAVHCLGGAIHGRLAPRTEAEARHARDAGIVLDRVLSTDDLVRGDNISFAATGVTGGELLRGVRFAADSAVTSSLVMRSRTGVVRTIESRHRLSTSSLLPAR